MEGEGGEKGGVKGAQCGNSGFSVPGTGIVIMAVAWDGLSIMAMLKAD